MKHAHSDNCPFCKIAEVPDDWDERIKDSKNEIKEMIKHFNKSGLSLHDLPKLKEHIKKYDDDTLYNFAFSQSGTMEIDALHYAVTDCQNDKQKTEKLLKAIDSISKTNAGKNVHWKYMVNFMKNRLGNNDEGYKIKYYDQSTTKVKEIVKDKEEAIRKTKEIALKNYDDYNDSYYYYSVEDKDGNTIYKITGTQVRDEIEKNKKHLDKK
jgi:hypothetical protein